MPCQINEILKKVYSYPKIEKMIRVKLPSFALIQVDVKEWLRLY